MVLNKIASVFGGDPHKREVEKYSQIVDEINSYEAAYEALSDEALCDKTREFKQRLADGETLDDLLPEAFAAVREASKRTIGLRHYDIQMIGGIALHKCRIAEMRTGEGKTLVATLPVYLNALTGKGVHLITVNDYLARRDARWMAPIYNLLGMSVGVLQMAARTENGKKAYLVDLSKVNKREDINQFEIVNRAEAYNADITYGTNNEFGFDYLRDNLTHSLEDRVQRGHYYAIVDEVDNILIDEARTPLIISGPASDNTEGYVQMVQVVNSLKPEDYEVNEKDRQVSLTEVGEAHVNEVLGIESYDPESDLESEEAQQHAKMLGFLEQALRAKFLFKKNKDYIVQSGKVLIVDEFTGRLMPGRRWSEGLHQAIEAKEGVRIEPENVTYATITLQNYFRMYEKLCGMTGTALTEAEEFDKIYKLDVLPIPMNLEYSSSRQNSSLTLVESKNTKGYLTQYYARKDDSDKKPLFWKRQDYPDVVFRNEEGKFRAIAREVMRYHAIGRPQLVGTTSVEYSVRLSARLGAESLHRLAQALLIRDAWLQKFDKTPELIIPELEFLNKPLNELNIGDLRPVARQAGLNSTNPEDPENLKRLLKILDLEEQHGDRVLAMLKGGIPHNVLNAREHDKESQIIEKAGTFGSVTIATNMAGRGVDIKLGGEYAEENLTALKQILRTHNVKNYYALNNKEILFNLIKVFKIDESLESMSQFDSTYLQNLRRHLLDDLGYQLVQNENYTLGNILINTYHVSLSASERIVPFWEHVIKEQQVYELGGLHIIGTERHEARRIDNQLRGRAARQGDPGSSRFYLSLDDDLMRLFGGVQMEAIMSRFKMDLSMPIESGLLGRMVEQAQERVEGNNFDIRKHLLEYDDVLNAQRKRVYTERNHAFDKADLHEDVINLLHTELNDRLPKLLKKEKEDPFPIELSQNLAEPIQPTESPWKLLIYLDEIQPLTVLENENVVIPPFSVQMVIDDLKQRITDPFDVNNIKELVLETAEQAIDLDNEHGRRMALISLSKSLSTFDTKLDERYDFLDNYFDDIENNTVENGVSRKPQNILAEISQLVQTPLQLSSSLLQQLPSGSLEVKEALQTQIANNLKLRYLAMALATIQQRYFVQINYKAADLVNKEWDEIIVQLIDLLTEGLNNRKATLLDPQGSINQKLDALLANWDPSQDIDEALANLLIQMSVENKAFVDTRANKRTIRKVRTINYTMLAARHLDNNSQSEISQLILDHLVNIQQRLEKLTGKLELDRFAQKGLPLQRLDAKIRNTLIEQMGETEFASIEQKIPSELTAEQRDTLINILGNHVQNEVYRHILISVISELWVDYLTQVDAVRISSSMENYAQRDPLVQYKSKATELFGKLLSDIRMGVISRMFKLQFRRDDTVTEKKTSRGVDRTTEEAPVQAADQKKKRKRH